MTMTTPGDSSDPSTRTDRTDRTNAMTTPGDSSDPSTRTDRTDRTNAPSMGDEHDAGSRKRPDRTDPPAVSAFDPTDSNDKVKFLVRSSPVLWLEVFGRILDKDGQIIAPKVNEYQRKIVMAYQYAQKHKRPCRLICLKPRQKGSSTISTALAYTHLRNFRAGACFVGNKDKTTQNLLMMLRRYNDSDKFAWGNSGKVLAEGGNWTHGSRVVSETAGASDPGRSGTFQVLLCSEVAHWNSDGVRSADTILNGLLNCTPYRPDTLVIMESTPNGAAGAFYERYQNAMPLEDFMSGKPGDGYVRIFSPWFEFADSEDDLDPPAVSALEASLTYEEREIMTRYNLRLGHISYRRRTIATECQGDSRMFNQEYPSNEEDCWLASGRLRFDGQGMKAIETNIRTHAPAKGVLDVQGNRDNLIWRQTEDNEAAYHIWEQPRNGCSYLLSVDVMTGSQASGKDPDCHSALVIRAPYVMGGMQYRAAVVARIAPPCRYDLDLLSNLVVRLSKHYGNCLIIPEVNGPGLALIELLRQYPDIHMYRRQAFDQMTSQTTEKLGWQTSDGAGRTGNRSMLIERLAAAIRDQEIDIWCPSILSQMRAFVVTDKGKAEALRGKHDDDVMSLSIGYFCLSGATTKMEAEVVRQMPRDLATALIRSGQPSISRQFS